MQKRIIKKQSPHLSSGSTLLNLACTNSPMGAFPKGKYIYIVGDSTSGKTFISMTCFAEALRHPEFKNYTLIYDNVEDGCLMDLQALFGTRVAEQVRPPAMTSEGDAYHSTTIEEFYYHADDAVLQARLDNQPFIYILDSMDGLSSEAEESKFNEQKTAHRKGKEAAGSYGDGKAKKNSAHLRKVLKGVRDTGSILIVISQTRDSLGFGFEKKARSGGHALRFYATLEIWTSLGGRIKKNVRGKDRNIGIHALIKIKKNRVTGELYETFMDIYPSYGIDDIGSCIDYLIKEGWWQKSGQKIDAGELEIVCTRDKLVQHIEENGLYKKLQLITGRCWNDLREAVKPQRKKRYEEETE